jgi:hypothetical protein
LKGISTVLSVGLLFAVATSAHATPIHNNFGLSSPATTITFNEIVLPNQTELLNTYQALGVVFGAGMRYDTSNFGIPNASPNQAVNFVPFVDPFVVSFVQPLTSAAMIIATNDAQPNTTIRALLGGNLVESAAISTSQSGSINFFGFTGIVFDQIQISNVNSGIVVDNIQLGEVSGIPEPASIVLLGSGLAAVAARRRRRK